MNKSNRLVPFLCCFGFILIRWYRLWDAPFFDYDSVKNTLVAKEILSGNFTHLFQHGSPLIHLIHALFYPLLGNHIAFLPPVFESAGLVFMLLYLFDLYKITDLWTQVLAYTSIGLSFLMIHLGRNISVEPYSIFIFPFWLRHYILYTKNKTSSIKHLVLLGLLLLINYKMLLLIPFVFATDIIRYKIRIPIKEWFRYLYALWIVPACIVLSYATTGVLFRYPVTFLALLFSRSGQQLETHASLIFYTKYLIRFENPMIWIGILAIFFILLKKKRYSIEQKLMPSLCIYWILIMSFLPAAPRGISIIVPLLLFFGTLLYSKALCLIRQWKIYMLIISIPVSLGYEAYIIQTNTFRYSEQQYDRIAKAIENKNVKILYTTLSNGIIPYLDSTIQVIILKDITEWNRLPSGSYVLSDAEAILNGWKEIPVNDCIFSVSNPCKQEAMLALENAEFAGYDFEEALLASKKVSDLEHKQLCLNRVR